MLPVESRAMSTSLAGPRKVPRPGTLTLLGTGTSVGVPVIGCDCKTCLSDDPRNSRTRCGVAVHTPEGTILIDTPTELRMQLVRESIRLVHAALYTHAHADHIFGLDDLRICGHRLDAAIPLYCEENVEQSLRQTFHYAFAAKQINPHRFAIPRLEFHRLGTDPVDVLGLQVRPIRLWHGKLPVLGFRFGRVAYCTDVSRIPDESWPLLEDLDVLVLDALREKEHPTHFNIEQALAVVERVKPRQTYFTHLACSLEYHETNAKLPADIELAYDGLTIAY